MQRAEGDKIVDLSIADPRILKIPIEENNEELIDLMQWGNPRIKHISELEPKATVVHNLWSRMRKSLGDAIIAMLGLLPEDTGIAVMEALRPVSVQKIYFDLKLKEVKKEIKDETKAREEASKFISPPHIDAPVHCTGAAIDMTLFRTTSDGTSQLLDMGKIGALENEEAGTMCPHITEEQARNRRILMSAACKAGLVNYGMEWWHFSYGDRMWAFANAQPAAIYGAVRERREAMCAHCALV